MPTVERLPAASLPDLPLRSRLYGSRSRVRRFRWELAAGGRPLVRWFPRSWFTDPLALVDICSPWEAAWCTRHLSEQFRGRGAVVELGPWLGSITAGIARGLRRRAAPYRTTIHTYDLFVFDDIEERIVDLPIAGMLHDGEDFLDLYLDRLGDLAATVEPHRGDVLDARWSSDAPIEFLFDDVAKTWEIWNHVVDTFHRRLLVGGTVVEQDWAHACTPWIHLWHHRWRDHLTPIGQVPNAGSVAFRLDRELPEDAFEPTSMHDYPDDEVEAAFDWAAALVDPERRPNVRAALVQLHTLHGDLDTASRICVRELAESRISSELVDVALPVLADRLAVEAGRPGQLGDPSAAL
jgi:hypothetical protein